MHSYLPKVVYFYLLKSVYWLLPKIVHRNVLDKEYSYFSHTVDAKNQRKDSRKHSFALGNYDGVDV